MPHPSEQALELLTEHVGHLDELRKLDARRELLKDMAERDEPLMLSILETVGAVSLPVEEGEWQLRADRDESGPFVDTRYEDKQWSR